MLVPLVVLTLLAWDGPASSPDSPESLFAAFRENFKSFGTLKLQWRRDQSNSFEGTAYQKAKIAALEAKIADVEETPNLYTEKIQREIRQATQVFAVSLQARHRVQSYRTDRSRFLMVTAPDNWDSLHNGPSWTVPDEPLSKEMLNSLLNFTILAYSGKITNGFTWCMPLGKDVMTAQIRRFNYNDERNFFPPLGIENPEWGVDAIWHPIDTFFHGGALGFATVGRETINGHEAVIIERRTRVPVENGGTTNVHRFEVVRAWLDPKQGALPLRITWAYDDVVMSDPPVKTPLGPNPWKMLETTEIVHVEGAGFYPSKGTIKVYGPEHRELDLSKPLTVAPYSILMETTSWEAVKIVGNKPLNETFTIPIPKDTYYYDETKNYMVKSGHEDDNPAILPWSLCGGIVAAWLLYGIGVLVTSRKSRQPLAT